MHFGNICLFIFILVLRYDGIYTAKRTGKSDTYVMRYRGTERQAIEAGEKLDLQYVKYLLDDFYLFKKPGLPVKKNGEIQEFIIDIKEAKKVDKKIVSIEQEEFLARYPKVVTLNDANWGDQWHLQTAQSPGMNVYDAWDAGFTGSDIHITILDDGVDTDHVDLQANYRSAYSYDYTFNTADAGHKRSDDGHGTNCAGVAAAVANTICVAGVAYDATFSAVRILDSNIASTPSMEASALTHALSATDIYSNSWGPSDDGASFSDITSVQKAAFEKGVTQGRAALGVIYTWASGNGGDNSDDCNADGYSKSIYTIAVAAVSETTGPTWYSEHCSAILTATYSGDSPNRDITTTGPDDTCVNDFSGTSSACPVASGIIAQTLEANRMLSWRDIQHLIVENSISTGLHANASFSTNGAGKKFSHYFGFGLMDAKAMVDAAPSWSNVPSYTTCDFPKTTVNRYSYSGTITETYTVSDCFISYLEFVEVTIHYSAYYRGDITFELTSPSSTTSVIFSQRIYDFSDLSSPVTWTFMTVHFWGEDPAGTWTLTMTDQRTDTDMNLFSYQLLFYGTVTNPLSGTPSDGTLGGSCTTTADCSSVSSGGCLLVGKICVTCDSNHRIVNDFCVKDGHTNGYCDDSIACLFSPDQCINNVCKEEDDDDDDSTDAGLIAGAVVGGVIGVGVIGGVGYFLFKKLNHPNARVGPAESSYPGRGYAGNQPGATHFQPSHYDTTNNYGIPPTQYY